MKDLHLVRVQRGHHDTPTSDFLGLPATAWQVDDDPSPGHATLYIRPPFDRVLFARARVRHEVEHAIVADFSSNDDHHPWWHFCGRSAHALRLTHAHLKAPAWIADSLLADGHVAGLAVMP